MDRHGQRSGKGMVCRLAVVLGSAALVLPLAEPVGQRAVAVARTLLAMAATATATPAQAQTVETLVSNSGKSTATTHNANRVAQAFTTGANASGYTLTSITLHGVDFADSNGNTVTLHSGSRTGTKVADFTATISSTTLVLTPTSTTTLAKETTYYVVTGNDLGSAAWQITLSNDEDSGAADGWSIADGSASFSDFANTWGTSTSSHKITVKGYANNNPPTVANQIEDQTAMEGTTFSFAFPDTTFADEDTDDTLTYTAMLSDDSALPTWLSFDDTTRTFSGTPQASDGGTITVRVTASDGTDDVHDDFEIKVATVCAEPDFGTRRQIWTGTVTVGGSQAGIHTAWGYDSSATSPGILSDTDFDIGANNYTITGIYVADINVTLGPGDLSFDLQSATGLTNTEVAALKLHVCATTPYDFSAASAVHFVEETAYTWDLDLDWSAESTRTLYLSLPANNAATGLPTISSDAAAGATVGDTLSANQGAIADSDGLPATFPDDYAFQWMREDEDGMNGEDISGEMSSTYTLTADDVGRKVRVRVSFTDQLSGMETVTSDPFPATGTVIPIPPTVTLSGPSPAVEEGNDLAFTLTLDVAAPADLTVNLTVAETEDVVAGTDVGSRTVTVMEGQTQAMFTVATENDDVDEADSVVTVTVTADSDDPATYEVGSPSQATVTVTDDDERGVTVMPPQLTMNENSTGAYTVVLTSRPTDDVTITPSSDNSDVTFTPATLTFTAANWSTAQTVMVTAAQDADSTDDSATISHVVTGGADYGANNVTAASVAVTVSEVVVTIAAVPSPVSEGTAAVFTLMRTGIATDALAVDVMVTETGDVFAGTAPTEVTLGANLSTATLSVATRNDDVDEADSVVTVTVVADSDTPATYNVGSPSQATVTITDDDERGVTVSGSPVRVNEGGTGTYTVVLTSRPTGEVTITPSSNNDDVSVSPTTLTFTTSNWETTQTVTVTTVEDENTMDDTATITHTVTGADYQGITVDSLTVTVSEAVLPSVTIAAGLSPVTEGTAVTFTLTRTDPTTEELVVGVSVTENGEVISGSAPTYVTFDADSTTATLSVSTDDDNVDEDAGTVTVTVAMDSANPATYRLGDSVSASMTVDDNESSPVVTLLLSPDTIAKADGMSEIQAMLSGPSAVETRVTVSISADVLDAVELDPDPPVLVIPPGTTASSNAVTLTPVDNDVEASEDLSVTVSGMGSNTVGVTGPEPVTLTITDDDETMTMDTTAPRVESIERQAPGASPTNADSLTWRITFSEAVMNVDAADFTVSGSTAMVSNVAPVSGEPLAYDVIVSGGDLANVNGTVTLGFAFSQNIQGEAGNALTNITPTGANHSNYAVDHAAPMVEIDVPATSTAPFPATISFNEVVSGFTVDDIMVSSNNAILSAFAESTTTLGTLWTVLVTPTADGLVTLEIAANVAEDAVGNGNMAAQASSSYGTSAMETGAKEEAKAVLNQMVLPELVQQLTSETTEVITSRLNTIASGSPLDAPPTLSLDEVVADTVAAFHGERERLENGSFEWRQALSGRDFVLPLSSLNFAQGESAGAMFGENPFSTLALWGGGNYSTYRNIIENTDIDGNGFSAVIGMDLQPIPRLTTGLALTTSRWGLDYATDDVAKGTYEIGVTMVNPYVNWLATEQLSLWATVGYVRGEVEQNPDGDAATNRTDGLTSWAGGVRFEVVPGGDPLTGEGSPFGLALKADGATSSFLDAQVQLARLAAEVSRSFAVENGLLRAALDLGWRIRSVSDTDDQDGQQQAVTEQNDGGGAELAGRLHWLSTDGSLSATVDTRVLLGGGHHREWGIGGHLRFRPSRRDGEGMSLTLQPSFGVTGTKLDKLWSLSGNSDLAIHNNQPNARLDAQLAYGFPLGNNALLTPYTELTWEETTNAYGAGLRYHLNPSLELDLKGARHHRANGNNENRLFLELRSHP